MMRKIGDFFEVSTSTYVIVEDRDNMFRIVRSDGYTSRYSYSTVKYYSLIASAKALLAFTRARPFVTSEERLKTLNKYRCFIQPKVAFNE